MGFQIASVTILLSLACLQVLGMKSVKMVSERGDVPPMVAFICGLPAMHLMERGWQRDNNTDCLDDPSEILAYCKKVYPNHDITNVVEASDKVTISDWYRKGHDHRDHHHSHSHTVRPFRCLEGAFQSDALLVPEHCVFDHIHKSKECLTFDEWKDNSLKSCAQRNMIQQSFAILLPCGVDMFSGVEFVCCPKENTDSDEEDYSDEDYSEEDEDYKEDDEEDDDEDESDEDESFFDSEEESDEKKNKKPQIPFNEPEDEEVDDLDEEDSEEKPKATPTPTDVYTEYLHKPSQFVNEHQYFLRAKSDLQKHHHEKVTKMMKEWAAARQRVQEMKATDQKAAEKLNKEITSRFQKTYQALEQEGLAEKKQLVALHQQRIQSGLNEKKRHSMEHYMAALQKSEPDAALILKALEHYIKSEQKDRMHTINHYEHMRDMDPDEAARIRQQTLDHLAIIDQRIQQSIEMLNRVPEFAKKIHLQIDEFMKTFHEIDVSISNILIKPVSDTTNEEILEKYKEAQKKKATGGIALQVFRGLPLVAIPAAKTTPESEPAKPAGVLHHVPLNKASPALDATKYDDEVMEDEGAPYNLGKPHIANQNVDKIAAQENYIKKRPMVNPATNLSAMAIAVGSIAVFVIIVVGIVVLRKRAQRVPVNHGFVEVDQAASPEERHVANMQINGYENPTYKYFEMNGNA